MIALNEYSEVSISDRVVTLWLNPVQIVYMTAGDTRGSTFIGTNTQRSIFVRETPQEIVELINRSTK